MARNEEKAMSMLNRWLQVKAGVAGGKQKPRDDIRPKLASMCKTLAEAEKWRTQLVKDASEKISKISGAGLGEDEIRDLNDNINRIIRIKYHWEKRIIELGGQNYMTLPNRLEDAGAEAPGSGYRYFGRAKDLPGVRELFKATAPKPKRLRGDVYKYVDADYYGYRDEDDGILVKAEEEQESNAITTAILEWHEQDAKRRAGGGKTITSSEADSSSFIAHVPLPSTQDIEKVVIEKRKASLLEKYASSELMQQEQKTKELAAR